MRRGNLSGELHRALGFLLLLVLLLSPPMRQEGAGAGVRARMGSMSARPPADGLRAKLALCPRNRRTRGTPRLPDNG